MPRHLLIGVLSDVPMGETRTCPYRVFLLSLLVLALASVGCSPGLHQVRLRTADGQVRTTTPRPRPPRGSAPTITGRPRSSGRSRCSTDA